LCAPVHESPSANLAFKLSFANLRLEISINLESKLFSTNPQPEISANLELELSSVNLGFKLSSANLRLELSANLELKLSSTKFHLFATRMHAGHEMGILQARQQWRQHGEQRAWKIASK
jgi:hypothetical protein